MFRACVVLMIAGFWCGLSRSASATPAGGLSLGYGAAATNRDHALGNVFTVGFRYGLSDHLDIICDLDSIFGDPEMRAGVVSVIDTMVTAGVRISLAKPASPAMPVGFYPFKHSVASALSISLSIGTLIVDSTQYAAGPAIVSTQVGPVARAAIEWLPMQGDDYALGFRLYGDVAHLTNTVDGGGMLLVVRLGGM